MESIRRISWVVCFIVMGMVAGSFVEAKSAEQPSDNKRFPWENNHLGMSTIVPKPWVPLKVDGSAVKWWGGRIDFGQNLLPVQITSRDMDLLSRPVTLVITVDGKLLQLPKTNGLRVTSRSDAAVVGTTTVDTNSFTITCTNTVEFDGMLRVDMTVTTQKGCSIDGLVLQVPMSKERAGFYRRFYTYNFDTNRVNRNDLVNSSGSTHLGWQIPFVPYVWLGQPEAGLEWFCETDQAWNPAGRSDALGLKPSAEEVVLEARMITQPLKLSAGGVWTATFGLSTTPSKPRLPNWRNWRYAARQRVKDDEPPIDDPSRYKCFQIFWSGGPRGLKSNIVTQPWPERPDAYRLERAQLRQQGMLYFPYGSLMGVPTIIPEWSVYGEEWSGGRRVYNWKHKGHPVEGSSTCIDQASYRDFVVWTYVEAIKQLDIDGIYFDYGGPSLTCINTLHSHGRLAKQGIYYVSLFGLREFYKRLYIATHEVKPDIVCLAHGQMPTLVGSFVDMELVGESSQRLFNKTELGTAQADRKLAGQRWYLPDYVEAWPVPWVLSQMGRNTGWFSVFLTQVTRRNHEYWAAHPDEARKYMRGALAMAALVDTHAITSGTVDMEVIRQYETAKDRFGPLGDDVVFYPFWRTPVVVALAPKNAAVYVTMYTRPDKALLILSNLTPMQVQVTIDPKLATVGVKLKANQAFEGMSNQKVPISADGKVSVMIAGKDLAVITLD